MDIISTSQSHVINPTPSDERIYTSVKNTLEQARARVETAVNTAMVNAYWEIGRQISEATGDRAEYGKHLLEYLSERLSAEFGRGYTKRNLYQMRQFYLAFPNVHTLSAHLSWSHYRRLMRIGDQGRREFYMNAAAEGKWTVRQLDRQIATFCYERILNASDQSRAAAQKEVTDSELPTPGDAFIKDPYVLDFLDLGDRTDFDEITLEQALVTRLQEFLLELGRGFAFVGRQFRLDAEVQSYYVDLVFYNIVLKCHVLIELKTRPLNPKDVGQMDFYVRLFDEKYAAESDNPTIGLILCSFADRTVAKYSALADGKGLFASSYVTYLPTEEEITEALEPTRREAYFATKSKE